MVGTERDTRSGAAEAPLPAAASAPLSTGDLRRLLVDWNDTATAYPDACIHELFAARAQATPDALAATFEDRSLSYRELDARANQLARHLQALGAGPDVLVGVCLDRSLEVPVTLLGILKAGAAYLPLDPEFPAERLTLMADDAQLPLLVTESRLADRVPGTAAARVLVDADAAAIAAHSTAPVPAAARPEHLAYVLYTSGSTGRPKGVMVEHRNVVNFFTGMDARIAHDPPGVWLAVTSLSFDISVLELLWTLTRGFHVVIQSDRDRIGSARPAPATPATGALEFSLFYWASEAVPGPNAYRLLLEGAKFADQRGFTALWMPERHFHAFGGLYPNPALTGAAVAAITERIQIRAGSVVLPLHSPIRVAEDWAILDNLSGGRVGIAFASGWMPNDFAIAPDRFADRHVLMAQGIQAIRRLWRGEHVAFPGPTGEQVQVATLPHPVQRELPVWVTAAGNPNTFRQAGALGASLLTHLLGQSVEEVAEKIAIYRQAWREHGHPGDGHVTLMLHTFVGDDLDAVRETVRAPLKEYLRTAVDLVRLADWQFPAHRSGAPADPGSRQALDSVAANPADVEALLDHAFERYFETSGLFGTPERCLAMVERVRAIGVDEIGCLVDFGIDTDTTLAHLEQLDTLRRLATTPQAAASGDYSIAGQIARHGVTHLQCTPSLAGMLLLDEPARLALRSLRQLLVGGEALPVALARRLRELLGGDLVNMYGPTETTIWSSTYRVDAVPAGATAIPIGRPIANTQLYILDEQLQPVPVGTPGELFIGGDGVVRGYLFRPELTAERFIADPFSDRPGARLYRTGDLARYLPDGNIEFLGRLDHQVKIRGHRIELGEIEAALGAHPAVREAVVLAREDAPGDVRLVGYVVLHVANGAHDIAVELRAHARATLPDYMVPAHVVELDAFPLTPNAKVDRKALPSPQDARRVPAAVASPQAPAAAPAAPALVVVTVDALAAIWARVLNVEHVDPDDNFFDLGGHSLVAMQLIADVRDAFHVEVPLRALFEDPTITGLLAAIDAARLETAGDAEIAAALAELDGLTDDEVADLLKD
jgi:natural product biosynthesis luciferase-like monooxygenase protein